MVYLYYIYYYRVFYHYLMKGTIPQRLHKVTVLAPRNAPYGRLRRLFEAKLGGLLGFANSLTQDSRAKSSKPHLRGHSWPIIFQP